MRTRAIQPDSSFPKTGVWWKMIVSIFILGVVGFIFSRYPTEHGSGWYHQLRQPAFAPPYWLPFVMWTFVYILMGCSVGIIWQYAAKSSDIRILKRAKSGIVLFIVHLIFNLLFPLILIGFQLPLVSLIDILILMVFIVVLIWRFHRISPIASYLLVPYLIWVIYATMLNVSIIVLN